MSFVTYNTPFDRAKSLRDELVTFANARSHPLPTNRYVQVGDIVRDCEAVIVSVGNLTPDSLYDPLECVSPRQATFLVEIVRNCAVVYDNQGNTIPSALESVSEQAALDGQLLYDFAADTSGWSSKQAWTVIWSISEGGLEVSSLRLTIGVP